MAWFILMPVDFAYFARSVIATALFGSNILFWHESGYFDAAAQLKPLLHTWSLAVEEQFYIFFPLILMASRKVGRARLIIILLSLAILTFALNLWETEKEPEFAFFMSPPRFWELLLGALLAIGALPNIKSRLVNQVLIAIGLGLIAVAVFAYSETTNFPGIAVMAPCLGATFILVGGQQEGPIVRLLSTRPVVFLGLISYSLYLWHWPIIVFVRYYFGQDASPVQALLIIIASLLISALSWRWIEQPFRRKQPSISRPVLFELAFVVMTAAISFGFIVNVYDGIVSRFSAEAMAVYSAKTDIAHFDRAQCLTSNAGGSDADEIRQARECVLPLGNPADGVASYVVWGDSHAGAMAPAIEDAARKTGQSGFLVSRGNCPPLLDFDTGVSRRKKQKQCMRTNLAVLNFIQNQRIPLVFLVARWPKYAHHADYGKEGVFFHPSQSISLDDYSAPLQTALDAMLAELAGNKTKVVLVMDVPEVGYDVPHALAEAVLTRSSSDIAPSPQAVARRQALAMTVLSASAAKYDATLVDPTPEFCDQERCLVKKDGHILYSDDDHLTLSGARSISHIFDFVFARRPAGNDSGEVINIDDLAQIH